jgi:hypothetical protein
MVSEILVHGWLEYCFGPVERPIVGTHDRRSCSAHGVWEAKREERARAL